MLGLLGIEMYRGVTRLLQPTDNSFAHLKQCIYLMPGVGDVHGDCKIDYRLKTVPGGMAYLTIMSLLKNKANLRDLIAATGLVISNWIQIVNFSARVTVKFDGWPCKTIGHLFYATSSFVHLFVPIGEFKLKLQSGNAQSGSNWMIFRAVRPWNLTDDLAKQ